MIKRSIAVAMSVVGLIVGAGFASGQEVLQYFIAFGMDGIWGAILAGILMIISGLVVLQLGSYFQADEHTGVLRKIGNPVITWIMDIGIIFTLFSVGFVMIAGGGANLHQQFGLPVWLGAAILVALVIAAGMLDVDKVSNVIGAITPFIIAAIVVAAVYAFTHSDGSFSSLEPVAREIPTNLPNWWISALNYAGLSLMVNVSMAIVIGGSHLYPREAGLGGLLGGVTFGIMLVLSALALFSTVKDVKDESLPMLTLVNSIHPIAGLVMSIIIFGMIFNTCLGLFYALGKRLTAKKPEKFRIVYISVTLVGFALSFVGFKTLVATVYPAMGYLGFVLIIVLLVVWLRSRSDITDEAERRKKIRDLAERKLDPNQRFTSKQNRQLRHLIGDSNVDDDELRAIIKEEVESEADFADTATDTSK